MKNNLLVACLILSWMLSSEALVIIGKLVSSGWTVYFCAILVAASITLGLLLFLGGHVPDGRREQQDSFNALSHKFGLLTASSLTLATHLSLSIILPTAMLVTAGFTFNETFVYWFPNFGFSYLLLGGILAFNLIGKSYAKTLLFLSTSIVLVSFLFLVVAGLTTPQESQITDPQTISISQIVTVCSFALLLFLGFDQTSIKKSSQSALLWTLLFGLTLLLLWGFVTFKFVDSVKLSQTTIPYIIAAREIFGQPGRIIIGLTIIFGTISIVNSLLLMAATSTRGLVHRLYPTASTTRTETARRLITTFIAGIIGACMGIGLAGSEHLEVYIFGVLLLWLLHNSIIFWATTMTQPQSDKRKALLRHTLHLLPLLAFSWLLATYPQKQQVTIFLGIIFLSSTILSAVLVQLSRKQTNHNTKENQL